MKNKEKEYKRQMDVYLKARHFCPVCGKEITQKIWDSQEPLSLRLEHSLGGDIGQWGDEIFNVLICSRKCFDTLLSKHKTLHDLDSFFYDFYSKKMMELEK